METLPHEAIEARLPAQGFRQWPWVQGGRKRYKGVGGELAMPGGPASHEGGRGT